MIQLLAGLESVDQLLNEPCPQNPGSTHAMDYSIWLFIATFAKQWNGALFRVCWHTGNAARSAWKALKAEYQERVQEVEGMIGTLRDRMEELQGKRKTLETLLSALQMKVIRLFFYLSAFLPSINSEIWSDLANKYDLCFGVI